MSVRLKLLSVSLLLCIALASVIFAAASTVQAYQNFTQNHQQITVGDTGTVSSWMTLHYIAHVYHIPESCLLQSLHLPLATSKKYASLRLIADSSHRSLDSVIQNVRTTIQQYRQHHLVCPNSNPIIQLLSLPPYPPYLGGRGHTA